MAQESNDNFQIVLVDGIGEQIDTVPWAEARDRISAYYGDDSEVSPEDTLAAIFTGRAHGA